jgi:hypothetical protein
MAKYQLRDGEEDKIISWQTAGNSDSRRVFLHDGYCRNEESVAMLVFQVSATRRWPSCSSWIYTTASSLRGLYSTSSPRSWGFRDCRGNLVVRHNLNCVCIAHWGTMRRYLHYWDHTAGPTPLSPRVYIRVSLCRQGGLWWVDLTPKIHTFRNCSESERAWQCNPCRRGRLSTAITLAMVPQIGTNDTQNLMQTHW